MTHVDNCQLLLTNLHKLLQPFFHELEASIGDTESSFSLALSPEQLALFAALYSPLIDRKILIAPSDIPSLLSLTEQIKHWSIFRNVNDTWHIIDSELTEQERDGTIHTNVSRAYHNLLSNTPQHHFIVTPSAISTPPPDAAIYQKQHVSLTVGETIKLQTLITTFVERGYIRHSTSLEEGSFRVHGETIDVHPPATTSHHTITLHGSTVEAITAHHGRRTHTVKTVSLPPVTFPAKTSEWQPLLASSLLIRPTIITRLRGLQTITLAESAPDMPFPLQTDDKASSDEKARAMFLLYTNKDRTDAYVRDIGREAPVYECESTLANYPIALTAPTWELKTEAAIFPDTQDIKGSSTLSYERALELIAELEVGKPAVHTDHGIGVYEGLQRRQIEEIEKEYLLLRYAEGDALYVPVEYAHKITPYVGASTPAIHRLGGTFWQKSKRKAKEDAVAFAKELLAISRKREGSARAPYVLEANVERELHATFPFALTPDQKRSWQEVQTDLQRTTPMDRLIVGDVGFGKTELAIRAARHVMENGKQVAVLAPTTLLVQQHFDTFGQRLPKYAKAIALLSRFVSAADQRSARQAIETGSALIAIGTHALLSNRTQWKNLGLVIIDEEQKFGVKQKEHFKSIRSQVDVLSLSATPIPRTLSMSLSGLRSLSVIATAPEGRKSIKTYVKKADLALVKQVLERELTRKGQVYVVAPKIRHLGAIREEIQAAVPQARTAIAHARLSDNKLSAVIHDFDAGNIDILISSSIVENGLDLPNVNTMIVWHAQHFGLAELYQLRGRIGRRQRQGYAYFLYNQDRLTIMQRERLTALTEASRLGSGWELARRDLEMRGAGNLLGAQQSGSVNSVGAQLYLDLVRQAVGEDVSPETDIQLPITALIPTHYIKEDRQRSRWYIRITRSTTTDQKQQYMEELKKTYGPLPPEVEQLFLLVTLQQTAARAGITKIRHQVIAPADEDAYSRLTIEGTKLPEVLSKLGSMGRWAGRGHSITLDLDAVTVDTVRTMIAGLVH
ncbi:MAG: DEAD/DEAH box helicase [Candidatus Andersenbacteria bacterium]